MGDLVSLIGETRFKIMRALQRFRVGSSLSDVSKSVEISPQEARRNLMLLEESGLVVRDDRGRYRLTTVGTILLEVMHACRMAQLILKEGGWKDFCLPCSYLAEPAAERHPLDDGTPSPSDAATQRDEFCLDWPICPLVMGSRMDHGVVRLYNAINHLLSSTERYLYAILFSKDLISYLIQSLLTSPQKPEWLTLVYPPDINIGNQNRDLAWSAHLLRVPRSSIVSRLKGQALINEMTGLYIPLDRNLSNTTFFIECSSKTSYNHLKELVESFISEFSAR